MSKPSISSNHGRIVSRKIAKNFSRKHISRSPRYLKSISTRLNLTSPKVNSAIVVFEPKSMLSENWSESTVKNALRANESKSSHAVVYPIQSTVIGRSDNAGPQGKGYGEEIDPMFTLDGAGSHAVAFHHKQTPISGDVSPALGTTSDGMGIMESQSVRRLTPRECERLQGFPDDWTAGQADSSRYRQMGNAVAVPVVQWIIKRIING
ncbi:MAG: hypothetical protein EBQ97_06245 [Bacteroidetes bacterium]|nr:hypothetical protein [Bacteroidota bacterium]